MSYCLLVTIFFKVGLFTIGGGLASLGLLHDYLVAPGYLDSESFYNMFAISQSTPGPIGINMATYVGFEYYGITGAVVATLALVMPSFIIITILAYTLKTFSKNRFVIAAFSGFRPAAIAIILSVTYMLITNSVLNINKNFVLDTSVFTKLAITLLTVIAALRLNIHPILCIILSGITGAIFL